MFTSEILSDVLLAELPAKLPCPFDVPSEAIPYTIRGSGSLEVTSLISNIITTYDRFKIYRITEDCLHIYWDEIILGTLGLLAIEQNTSVMFSRNSVDIYRSGTTQRGTRPGLLVWMNDALIFRGEEKSSHDNFIDAESKLRNKFGSWNALHYGRLPFVLAYATGGFFIK